MANGFLLVALFLYLFGFVFLGGCSREYGWMQAGCSRAAGRSWGEFGMKLGFR
jgi:hypothetical protein